MSVERPAHLHERTSSTGHAHVYYVSPTGKDDHDGRTPERAWRTLAHVSAASFGPGSHILFEGGRVFAGRLELDERAVGTVDQPIVVGTYGSGRAILDAGYGYGVLVRNTGGVCIENLIVRGAGPTRNLGSGIAFENDRPGDLKLAHVRIDHVAVRGFGYHGVVVDGKNSKSGFRDVRITHVDAQDNALSGITVQGSWHGSPPGYAHEDVYIGYASACRNPGAPGQKRWHSGSGIVLSDVDRGTVEHSLAFGNGQLCSSIDGGPVGIWAWDSNAVLIQFNVSCRNRTAGGHDGGGFDLDGGVSNSCVQYNLSFENDGAGYLLTSFPFGRPHVNNIVRRNISWNDGRKNSAAGIQLAGAIANANVERNSVFVAPAAEGTPSALAVFSTRLRSPDDEEVATNTRVRNNILHTVGDPWLVRIKGHHRELDFDANTYVAEEDSFRIDNDGVRHAAAAAWRMDTQAGDRTAEDAVVLIDHDSDGSQRGAVRNHRKLLDWLQRLAAHPDLPQIEPNLEEVFEP
jgi:hypothetical protein